MKVIAGLAGDDLRTDTSQRSKRSPAMEGTAARPDDRHVLTAAIVGVLRRDRERIVAY
jgi:hypothetical protein